MTTTKDKYSGYYYGTKCSSNPMIPYSAAISLEDSVKAVVTQNNKWATWKPGSKYLYSNYGSGLAGLLVEKHSG